MLLLLHAFGQEIALNILAGHLECARLETVVLSSTTSVLQDKHSIYAVGLITEFLGLHTL